MLYSRPIILLLLGALQQIRGVNNLTIKYLYSPLVIDYPLDDSVNRLHQRHQIDIVTSNMVREHIMNNENYMSGEMFHTVMRLLRRDIDAITKLNDDEHMTYFDVMAMSKQDFEDMCYYLSLTAPENIPPRELGQLGAGDMVSVVMDSIRRIFSWKKQTIYSYVKLQREIGDASKRCE